MNDSARVHLALELTGTPEHIEGTLHRGGLPALSFSGWSELFAALQTVACEASPPVRHSSSEARTDG